MSNGLTQNKFTLYRSIRKNLKKHPDFVNGLHVFEGRCINLRIAQDGR